MTNPNTTNAFPQYKATAGENEVDAEVVRMSVTDKDEEHSPNSNAKFTIVGGDPGNLFSVKTGSNKLEGIITTAKVGEAVYDHLFVLGLYYNVYYSYYTGKKVIFS